MSEQDQPSGKPTDEAPEQGPGSVRGDDDGGAGKKTLGLERWVQFCFVAIAALLFWLLDNLISAVWYVFADPDDLVVTAMSLLAGVGGSMLLYRHKALNLLSHEVAEELSKVTWPSRKETSSSTVVVIVTSIIAAVLLGVFDAVWSQFTDLVYKV